MVATHNVKVNGRWYRAGQEIPEEKASVAEEKSVKADPVIELKAEEPAKEEVMEAPKRASSRRKTTK